MFHLIPGLFIINTFIEINKLVLMSFINVYTIFYKVIKSFINALFPANKALIVKNNVCELYFSYENGILSGV